MPEGRNPQVSIFMVSSRDRRFRQCRDCLVRTVARTPPPAFLFPNQRCQRPDRLSPTPLFSAGGRRRRLSSGRPLWCQSILSDFLATLRKPPEIGRKNRRRAAEGLPSYQSVAIRLRLGKIPIPKRKSRAVLRPLPTLRNVLPARAGGGYLVAVPVGVNQSFRTFRRRAGANPDPAPAPVAGR
jgi:hypothetical protein